MRRRLLGLALSLVTAGCMLESGPDSGPDEAVHSLDVAPPAPAVPMPDDTAPHLPAGTAERGAPLDTAKPTPDPWAGTMPAKPTPDPWAGEETGTDTSAGGDSTSSTDTASESQAARLPPSTQ